MDRFSPNDTDNSEKFDPVSFSKSSLEVNDFQKVEKISEDQEMKKNSDQLQVNEVLQHKAELEIELEFYKTKYRELCEEVEEYKMESIITEDNLILERMDVDVELEEHTTLCYGLKERVTCLEEENRLIAEIQKRTQEMVKSLEDNFERMNRDEREKFVQLKRKNKDLECAIKTIEDEIEVCKDRFNELERQYSRIRCEGKSLKAQLEGYKTKSSKMSLKLKDRKREYIAIKDEFDALFVKKDVVDDEIKEHKTMNNELKELIMYLEEEHEILKGSEKRAEDRITNLLEELKTMKSDERQKYVQWKRENRDLMCKKTRAEDETDNLKAQINRLQTILRERETKAKERITGPSSINKTSLGESKNISQEETTNVSAADNSERSWDGRNDMTSKKCSRKPISDQTNEENVSLCDIQLNTTAKRCRKSQTVTSKTAESDRFPMGKLEMDKHKELKQNSSLNPFYRDDNLSPGSKDDLGLTRMTETIKRTKVNLLNWQSEADMLSSFKEDLELCMKAVCAIFRQQKSNGPPDFQGFNKFDAHRGGTIADFLMEGNAEGDVKKSVKELELFDPKALGECKRFAIKYSQQLFNIYKNKKDPFFLPQGFDLTLPPQDIDVAGVKPRASSSSQQFTE